MRFYVYEHWRPDVDLCFYVGKGSGKRFSDVKRRNKHHHSIVKKLARLGMCMEVRMVASDLSEHQAFEIERSRIAFWKGIGVRLANKTDGGEGSSGYRHTEAAKKKIKAQIISDETRAKLRDAMLRRPLPGPMSEEQKRKISQAKMGSTASEETRARMSKARIGAGKGVPKSPEMRANLSRALKGKPWTENRRKAQMLKGVV